MAFTSVSFLIFLLATLVLYYLLPKKLQWVLLLIASYGFYWIGGGKTVLYLVFTTLTVYLSGRALGALNARPKADAAAAARIRRQKKWVVLATVLVDFGLLFVVKYGSFTVELLQPLAGGKLPAVDFVLPLGISFYMFQSVGYVIDCYRGKYPVERNLLKLALFTSFFPQIVQGPISRFRDLGPQLTAPHRLDWDKIKYGIQLAMWGYFKKLVIADRLNLFITGVLGSYQLYDGLAFWVTALFSTFQLYADFSGCMDIVQGISELFGITVEKNFDHPFTSRSVAEWWRRWHITLCQWMKDYVYFPLAVSPHLIKVSGKLKKRFGAKAGKNFVTIVTIGVVWLLTGLWHGVKVCYLIWGLYYALFLIIDTIAQPKRLTVRLGIDGDSPAWQRFQMVRTTLIFSVGRLITVPDDFSISLHLFQGMFTHFNPWIFWDGSLLTAGLDGANFLLSLLLIALLLVVEHSQVTHGSIRDRVATLKLPVRWAVWYGLLAGILILGIYGPGYSASSFAYMNF